MSEKESHDNEWKLNYFNHIQQELVSKALRLGELLKNLLSGRSTHPKVLGDFYEEITREFIEEILPNKYSAHRGLIISSTLEVSREIDCIIYNSHEKRPLFRAGNIIVIPAKDVEYAIQIKSEITSNTRDSAIENLESVKKLNSQIKTILFGYRTHLNIESLENVCSPSINKVIVLMRRRDNSIREGQIWEFMKVMETVFEFLF